MENLMKILNIKYYEYTYCKEDDSAGKLTKIAYCKVATKRRN
jgi:hypothetical protein